MKPLAQTLKRNPLVAGRRLHSWRAKKETNHLRISEGILEVLMLNFLMCIVIFYGGIKTSVGACNTK